MGEREQPGRRSAAAESEAAGPVAEAAVPDAASLPRLEPRAKSGCLVCAAPLESDRCPKCGAATEAGGFRIERLLHESDHSRVYLARSHGGDKVALKELIFARAPDAATIESFEREARVLRALSHPAIPRFVASFQAGEGPQLRLYLVQEYVEGRSLEALAQERFDEAAARECLRQLLPVLGFLHARALVHRDLKPANILLRPDGRLALVDFGSARALAHKITYRATVSGTFGYLPPETLGGTLDQTADLYGLGATLVQLLSGRPPEELLWAQPRPRLREVLHISPALAELLERLTAHQRSDRCESAEAALAALEASPGEATAPPAVERGAMLGRLPSGKTLKRVFAGILLLAVPINLGIALLRASPRSLPPRTAPVQQQPRREPPRAALGVLKLTADGRDVPIQLDGGPFTQAGSMVTLVRESGYVRFTRPDRMFWVGYLVQGPLLQLRFESSGMSIQGQPLAKMEPFPVNASGVQVEQRTDGALVGTFQFSFLPGPPAPPGK